MPTPVLKIDVDDAAFKRFLDAFSKYQQQVEAQPAAWKNISGGISDTVIAGAAFAAEIAHQAEETRNLASEEDARDKAQRVAAQRRKEEDEEVAKREEAAAERRKKMLDQTREFGRTIASNAASLARWTVAGGALSMVTGALSLWGLGDLVGGVADQRRSAMGLGVSMSQQQGMGIQMQRYFDVQSTLENVANAQADPSKWGAMRMMGVNPNGQNTADTTYQLAIAARRMFKADKGNLALAGAQGLTNFFSADDLRRMAGESDGQFNSSIKQSRQYSGLNDDVGRKWQNFMVTLDTVKLKFENTLIRGLTQLENSGALDRIVESFGKLANEVVDRIDWKAFGDAADKFATYLGSAQFQSDFKDFIDDVSAVTHKMADLLRFLHIIPSHNHGGAPSGAGGPPSAYSALPGLISKGWHSLSGEAASVGSWASHYFMDRYKGPGNQTIADRNNNPGNIMLGGRYARFDTPQTGWAMMAHQLLVDYDKHGQRSIASLINDRKHGWSNEWSPGNSHSSTANYMAYVAKMLGVKETDQINLHDPSTMRRLVVAMNDFERGSRGTKVTQTTQAHVKVTVHNKTGASVATTTNTAAAG